MRKKRASQTQGSEKDKVKKSHSQNKKNTAGSSIPTQTNQPYEQDVKRRIGHFGGAGEPPLMKK